MLGGDEVDVSCIFRGVWLFYGCDTHFRLILSVSIVFGAWCTVAMNSGGLGWAYVD